jgi:hypothetical protein
MDDDRPEPHRLDATGDGDADDPLWKGGLRVGGQELSLSRARSHGMEAPLEYLER